MYAVFSKKGFIGLCKQNQHESFDDIMHLLKKEINFKFAFTKKDLQSLQGKNKIVVSSLLKKLTTNRGGTAKFEWGYIIPSYILERNYSKFNFDELSSLYFLDKGDAQQDPPAGRR